ncbi:MAG: SDR family oxidoreductase [Chloroflexi bacterium]|nr:SDR family oxidoreductase [Chloroflexota bacterium]MCY3581490.1 SDR family oxidoreductase [Chloroflexota bacterium]MCY3715134.1 SDR family oxidoreductase [Chloroflexota bacterium]MDE2650166.1 SDR family oxidoreductase [Chloroflexota bacterium]MXV93933.1 SDR family oxidoreductase [Chloroflexota bacterium]
MTKVENLRGQTAIITGAAQGLGYAIAKAYAREGMKLALLDIRGDLLAQVCEELAELGADTLALPCDLSQVEPTQAAIDAALGRFAAPRVLVHNAALLITRSMQQITFEQWQREINIILQAAFILSKACWQPMIDAGAGSIIYLSSGSGYRGFIEEVAYNPGKHGIEGLTKCLALEGAAFNIAVNAATPGAPINTPMSAANYTQDLKTRWVDPALLTPAFTFLARQTGGGLTGHRVAARADGSWDAINLL